MAILGSLMACERGSQNLTSEYKSNWVSNTSGNLDFVNYYEVNIYLKNF